MRQNIIFLLVLGILLGAAFVGGAFVGVKFHRPPEPPAPQVDTVWLPDTAKLTDSKPVGSVIATLPTARPDTVFVPRIDTVTAAVDTIIIARDSVAVEVPIEQRTYEGEHYRAVVQGFQPELVSIDIRQPDIAAPKRKWWSVTIGPQVGYGFTPAGWQPYAGVGVSVGLSF